MRISIHHLLAASVAFLASAIPALARETLVLNHPDFPFFHTTAMDQPRLYGLLTDGGEVILDANGAAVVFRAFIDTGSSGFVLSNLHAAANDYDVASFGFTEPDDYIGTYTNVGIGGEELGSVSRPFGVLLHNDPFPIEGEAPLADFNVYGEHNLWVRQAPGTGEVTLIPIEGFGNFPLVSPVNIVGMPVIEQRVMVMEWMDIPLELADLLPPEAKEMRTKLLPRGDSGIPATNITLEIEMRDFTGEASEGETLPSFSRNPLVKNVRISHDPQAESVTANWLFDTGAGSSFVGFNWAKRIGLIPESYPDLPAFVADHVLAEGMTAQVGGIGGESITVPILTVNEIRIPAREGFDIVWQNARVLIFDLPELTELGLDGIFGMNLIGPAATVDSTLFEGGSLADSLIFEVLSDITPSPFTFIAFEVTSETTGELRLFSDLVPSAPTSYGEWSGGRFDPADPASSDPEADPDHDGVRNLLEYALGLDPNQASRDRLPASSIEEIDGQLFLTLSYDRIKGATDLEFVVEVSDNLTAWTAEETAPVSVTDLGDRERVTVRDTQPWETAGRRFLRLRLNLAGSIAE